MSPRSVAAASAVIAVSLLLLLASVTVPNSPYDSNVETERRPFAPERPTTLTAETAGEYAVAYEESRLANDLIRSRGGVLDGDDEVRADCTTTSATEREGNGYRVALRCRGGIGDVYRIVQPTRVTYTVAYTVTDGGTEQTAIDGYPFGPRDDLREAPWAGTETGTATGTETEPRSEPASA